MGIINNRRLKRKQQQHNPTNPIANTNITSNKFDFGGRTIKEQQNKR